MRISLFLFVAVAISRFNFAAVGSLASTPLESECPDPWFTGPLLNPSSHVVPSGYINVEPYTFYTVNTGLYSNDWDVIDTPDVTVVNFQFLLYLGITPWMDILIVPQSLWNETQGVSTLVFGDFPVEIDIQLIDNSENPAYPALKFYVRESFPTGPYQMSKPERILTDLGGTGRFETTLGFVIGSLFELPGCHFLDVRLSAFVSLSPKVPVKGISFYGGAPNTDGTIRPGLQWGGIFAFQYNLNRNWAVAFDLEGIYFNKTTFRGFPGTEGNLPLGFPQRVSLSMAPAIEYNFNENVGIIAGSWFTFAGKNTPQFYSGVIAVNYYGPLTPKSKHKYRGRGGSGGSSAGSGGR